VDIRRLCALAGVIGPIGFTAGWLIAQAVAGPEYDPSRHALSELGAVGAPYAWVMLAGQAIGGVGTIAFALGALWPSVRPSRTGAVGSWLLALSGLGLDNVSDVFFRLDCRTADGCTDAQQTASWHGTVHGIVAITVLLLPVVPLILAWAFRRLPDWRPFVWPSVAVGVVQVALIGAAVSLGSRAGSGYAARAGALVASAWVVALAVRTLRGPRRPGP